MPQSTATVAKIIRLALPAVPPSPPPSLACGAHNDIRLVDCSGVVRRATERQAESVEILRATVLQPERALAGHATPCAERGQTEPRAFTTFQRNSATNPPSPSLTCFLKL
ncbi:hypothetical protein C8R44DRAFT_989053 [Mycena epipterygia]|nr:hypothetical protein C8R44DRAFT_989053 [Mycena epipterygia]